MNLANILGPVAMFSSLGLVLGAILQLIRIIKRKSAQDISLPLFIIMTVSSVTWLLYGISKNDFYIMITNVIYVAIDLPLLFFAVKYRKGRRQ